MHQGTRQIAQSHAETTICYGGEESSKKNNTGKYWEERQLSYLIECQNDKVEGDFSLMTMSHCRSKCIAYIKIGLFFKVVLPGILSSK